MSHTQPVTLQDIVHYPLPGLNIPANLQFSPDGRWLAYLHSQDNSLVRQLIGLELETGQRHILVQPPDGGNTDSTISREEALRRERLRQREFGVTEYHWSPAGQQLLLPLRGSLYIQDDPGSQRPLRLLVAGTPHPCLDPHFSPDGQWVAYVQDAELYVVPVAGGQPQQITSGARGSGKTNGLAEYIAQEEFSRGRGYWWSPDSQSLAFVEVDETHIPAYPILHLGQETVGEESQEWHRYPFAGQANAKVRLGVVPRTGGAVVWQDLGPDDDIYLVRVHWANGRLLAQRLNRLQTTLDLLRFDSQTGAASLLLQENSPVWINVHNLFRPLANGRFIWGSERSGFQHLYLYDADGRLIRPLTAGDWLVESIVGVDQQAGLVYFTATQASPLETDLYAVSLEGGPLRPLTSEPGMHQLLLDVGHGRFVDTHHHLQQPPHIQLRALSDGRVLQPIFQQNDPRLETVALVQPETVTLTNRAGVTLYGTIYRPPSQFGDAPFPTIVSVYGGPHAQRVVNSWGTAVDMRAQYLAQQGFLVFKLDNQGSARRGLAFEGAIKHRMGQVEVDDQVDGVRWLVQQGLCDPARVGIYGWSYGGYMTLMSLLLANDTFRVGVAGAPVTHWDGYDTGYTERYMGTPQANPDGYQQGSVMAHIDNLQGKLLLIHGLIDENVHFRHTARLMNALNRSQKRYDLLLFPDERHMPRHPADRLYLEERVCAYFQEYL